MDIQDLDYFAYLLSMTLIILEITGNINHSIYVDPVHTKQRKEKKTEIAKSWKTCKEAYVFMNVFHIDN